MTAGSRLSVAIPRVFLAAGMSLLSHQLLAQVRPVHDRVAEVRKLGIVALQPNGEQSCPAIVRFQAHLEAATKGIVRYRLRGSDGVATPYSAVLMGSGEGRDIVHFRRVGTRGAATSGWVQVEVYSAKGPRTARVAYRVHCAAATGAEAIEVTGANLERDRFAQEELTGERLDERLREYLLRRGYRTDSPFDTARANAYERLRRMRELQRKRHVTTGWLNPSARDTMAPSAPGGRDASLCAWSSVGPTNINGRVTQIAIDPTNNQRLFVTTVGGIWRSIDGARRWQRVSDDFLSTVFASVVINPATPTEVLVGAGDPNYHGAWKAGIGIWRSTTGGDPGTWTKVSPSGLDGQVIYRIRIDPAPPNNVYVASSNGVYLGTRTGTAITFTRLAGFDAWTNDIVVDFSVTPRVVYAGVRSASTSFARGIWKYNGTAWNQRNTGIPTTNSRTIVLALAPSNPATLYAKVESDDGHSQGVYKTTTAGEPPAGGGNAWATTGSALDDSCAGTFCYSWYNSTLEVDPTDPNTVWGGGLSIYRTVNGGTAWTNVGSGNDPNFPLGVHADHHAVAFDPSNSKIVYVGNDGGLFRTSSTATTTWRWNNVAHGMIVTEYYRSTSQHALAGIAAGGTQDNGTIVTFGNRTWYQPGGCDGNDVAIDAANASTLYANCNGSLYEFANPVPGTVGGSSTISWSVPTAVSLKSPLVADPGVAGSALAAGVTTPAGASVNTWSVYRTSDGINWSSSSPGTTGGASVTTVAIAPPPATNTYYVGISGGAIWRSTDGGVTWLQTSTGLPAGASVNGIAIDFTNSARAIAATSGGAFLTVNTGATWTPIPGAGTAALPTNAITGAAFNPANANDVFLATDVGVFRGTITPAAGATPATAAWTPFDEGLPDGLDVNDIWINRTTNVLKIGTMGHGAYQREVTPGLTCAAAQLLVRDNVNDRGLTPSPSGVPDPEHPIPDPARPGFYMPDNTSGGLIYWWKSTDVRIDVPATAPPKNQIAAADHVEMESCPILLSSCPAGTILDQYPQRGRTARVYAQVGNVGLQPASNVRVIALFADASSGLPPLPNDFWTTTFPAGSTSCGALNTGTGWNLTDVASPCRVIPAVNPEMPEAVAFNWAVPAGQAQHSCMLIIAESANDPLDPAIRATNQVAIAQLVPNNRQISLRNLHVIDATVPTGGGAPQGVEPMNVPNPSRELAYVELVISRVDVPHSSLFGVLLPTARMVEVHGASLAKSPLTAPQRRAALQMKVRPAAFYRVTDRREAILRLPIPPGDTWHIGVVYDTTESRSTASVQWSVVARQGKEVLGGNTYIVRPRAIGRR